MIVYNLHKIMIEKNHVLIAGSSGCGKSTLIRDLLYTVLVKKPNAQLYLIDPKRLDLRKFDKVKNTVKRSKEMSEHIAILSEVIEIMDERFADCEARDLDITDKNDIYVVIDEAADLLLDRANGKEIEKKIIRLVALGRAARIHVIFATQTILKETCGTLIRNNFDCIVGMRTATAMQSRTIFGLSGTEKLPDHGVAYIQMNGTIEMYKVPMVSDGDFNAAIEDNRR